MAQPIGSEKRVANAAAGRRPGRSWVLIILLLAAGLRIYGLNHVSPPGLEHDEVANWLIDRSILAGHHALYFTDAYGHEALFHYWQSAFVALLGDHALALRLPAVFAGLLGLAVSFALARQLFGQKVAVTSLALLATLFWPVFYSRLGLRAISLPLVSGLSAYYWWRAWRIDSGRSTWAVRVSSRAQHRRHFLVAGFFAGLSLHTYMAARAVPIFYAIFLMYLAVFHRHQVKQRWRGILLFWLVQLVVAAPLLLYLQTNPGSEFRISEIDAPLRALLSGRFGPVIANSLKILGMFGFAGDPLWRQNVAGLPVFDPLVAGLFYLSLLFCLRRLRDSRYAFLLLWLLTSALPSIVTIDAPSSIRISNSLPVLTIFPALVIHNSSRLSTVITQLSTVSVIIRTQLWLAILILYYIGLTSWALFSAWPNNEEVQFVWQSALRDAVAYLDREAEAGPVAIAGWTPDTMDPPTVELFARRTDLRFSYFEPTRSLLIPANTTGGSWRILRPTILPMDPLLEAQLAQWGAKVEEWHHFTLYRMASMPAVQPQFPDDVIFGEQMRFLGYDRLGHQPDTAGLVTYWQVTAPVTGPRRLFLHLVDDAGQLLAEDYALDRADSRWQSHWQPGDILLQRHPLARPASPAAGPLNVRLGLFDPNSCPPAPCHNLLTEDGATFHQLQVSP